MSVGAAYWRHDTQPRSVGTRSPTKLLGNSSGRGSATAMVYPELPTGKPSYCAVKDEPAVAVPDLTTGRSRREGAAPSSVSSNLTEGTHTVKVKAQVAGLAVRSALRFYD